GHSQAFGKLIGRNGPACAGLELIDRLRIVLNRGRKRLCANHRRNFSMPKDAVPKPRWRGAPGSGAARQASAVPGAGLPQSRGAWLPEGRAGSYLGAGRQRISGARRGAWAYFFLECFLPLWAFWWALPGDFGFSRVPPEEASTRQPFGRARSKGP